MSITRIQRMQSDTHFIRKTCLYNLDPLKHRFYIVKLGFTGVYIIFLIFTQKHRLWVPRRGGSNEYHNLCFEQKYEKYQNLLSENFQFLVVKFSIYLNRRVFVMYMKREDIPLIMSADTQRSFQQHTPYDCNFSNSPKLYLTTYLTI